MDWRFGFPPSLLGFSAHSIGGGLLLLLDRASRRSRGVSLAVVVVRRCCS